MVVAASVTDLTDLTGRSGLRAGSGSRVAPALADPSMHLRESSVRHLRVDSVRRPREGRPRSSVVVGRYRHFPHPRPAFSARETASRALRTLPQAGGVRNARLVDQPGSGLACDVSLVGPCGQERMVKRDCPRCRDGPAGSGPAPDDHREHRRQLCFGCFGGSAQTAVICHCWWVALV